jgi:3-hydroxybutyryl-CoA dehydrogenase
MGVDQIKRIAIIGAGLMGHGYAQEFALAGYPVQLQSRSEESVQRAMTNIRRNLKLLIRMRVITPQQAEEAPTKIQTTTGLKDAVEDADLVIESVYEDLALKQRIFKELDAVCPEHTILVSGTSTLPLSALQAVTHRPDRVLLANYSNPPYMVPLVEMMRNERTSDDTVTTVYDLLTKIGKRPVIIQKEIPGFIANRLQGALLREALWLVQKGFVTPHDVDTIMKTSIGRRWSVAGPFEVFDVAGWDLVLAVASWLLPYLESSPEVPQIVKEKVERGELGVKTGKGFYEWTPASADALRQRIVHAFAHASSRE